MCKKNLIRVMAKMHVLVDKFPAWGDVVQIDTWKAASRKNGMCCNWIIWVMMNKETRRLSKFPHEVRAELNQYFLDTPPLVKQDTIKCSKQDQNIVDHVRNGLTPRWSDLDINQHVNNVKYIGWILESVPETIMENYELGSMTLDHRISSICICLHDLERTRWLLTSAAYVHLKHLDVSKYTRNLAPASRAILLSGPAEFYHQKLAKALSHDFEAKLLMVDIVNFSIKSLQIYSFPYILLATSSSGSVHVFFLGDFNLHGITSRGESERQVVPNRFHLLLYISIYSPNVVNLTPIDLPGFTKVAVGERTSGVLTKIDLMDQGTDAVDFKQAEDTSTKLNLGGLLVIGARFLDFGFHLSAMSMSFLPLLVSRHGDEMEERTIS
ncbi:hypothetical protein L1987_31422 [Smallanthus sonchifolius]|uniref:Uncharacterized protein n=1 Tax=Smallanthus sonchifolius TaxID=185202 RepID=A0ACB9I5D6_9ASTR|nr:hypothetical protein L1987_31422 [Smallanthus sonchifolius]